jgi:hypothetical protein
MFPEALDVINFDHWRNLWQRNVINNKAAARAVNSVAVKRVRVNRVARVVSKQAASKAANRVVNRLPGVAKKKVVNRRAAAKDCKAAVGRATRVAAVVSDP